MNDFFATPASLQTLPTTRAAYSDRTAWMMSEMSALAYLKFEGEEGFKEVLDGIRLVAEGALKRRGGTEVASQLRELEARLTQYIDTRLTASQDKPPALAHLEANLSKAGFTLSATFDESGTQAFLAKREPDKVAVLAFRGTEADSWKDIHTDLQFRFYKGEHGLKVHRGFRDAYAKVGEQIRSTVDRETDQHSLYVTGHSLGGALAIIAAKELERDSLAACYTFGNPRVGNDELGEEIRTPVYRIVNAADGVPRVPPSWTTRCVAFLVAFIRPSWGDAIEKNFCGYMHQGDMRYLTACDADLSRLKVIPNLSMPFRAWRMARRMIANGPSIAAKDHRIDQYRTKLRHYAEQRAKPNSATPQT